MGKTVPFCRGSCRPKKPAQSGYENYCKSCYKKKFPRKFYRLTAERYSHACELCGEKDLRTGAGVRKPCIEACSCSSCDEINMKKRAAHCKRCPAALFGSWSRGRGSRQARLARWCTKCFAPEQIASRPANSGRCGQGMRPMQEDNFIGRQTCYLLQENLPGQDQIMHALR